MLYCQNSLLPFITVTRINQYDQSIIKINMNKEWQLEREIFENIGQIEMLRNVTEIKFTDSTHKYLKWMFDSPISDMAPKNI